MKYYRRNPGDYLSSTRHLSMIEHGAYGVLIDTYYATEDGLPTDKQKLYRIAGAHSRAEKAAVDRVIAEFFDEVDGWFVQDRIETELNSCREKIQKLAASGSVGGQHKAQKSKANPLKENKTVVANARANAKADAKEMLCQPLTSSSIPNGIEHSAVALPAWLDATVWEDWRAERKSRRKTMSHRAEQAGIAMLTDLRRRGHDPTAVIRRSIANGWSGLFELPQQRTASGKHDERTRVMDEIYGRNQTSEHVIDGTAERLD